MKPVTLDNFGKVFITLNRALRPNECTDLGSITIEANGNQFILDISKSATSSTEIVCDIERDMNALRETFSEQAESESGWNLQQLDLLCSHIEADMFVGGESYNVPWEIKYAYIEINGIDGIERLQLRASDNDVQDKGDMIPENKTTNLHGGRAVIVPTGSFTGTTMCESTTCVVGRDGTIDPSFSKVVNTDHPSSGRLKYFQELAGKRVRVTIEILED